MLERIHLKRKVNEDLNVGEVVEYLHIIFVIINIINVKVVQKSGSNISVVYDCLAQKYKAPSNSKKYTTTQAELTYDKSEFNQISQVGDLVFDELTGIWVTINSILNVSFREDKMIVKYEFTPVLEWSSSEMEKRIKSQRKTKMKLIKYKKIRKNS